MLLTQDQKGLIQDGLGDASEVPPAYAAYDILPPSPPPPHSSIDHTATRRVTSAAVAASSTPVAPSPPPPHHSINNTATRRASSATVASSPTPVAPPPSPPHRYTDHTTTRRASSATAIASPEPVAGPSSVPPRSSSAFVSTPPVLKAGQSSPAPASSFDGRPTSLKSSSLVPQRPRGRKNASWVSHLPFVSSFSAKRARNSVLSIVSDLVVPSPRRRIREQKSPHEILASLAETCAEHKLCLSTILQEASIAEHTPLYWAIIYDRQALLEALLVYSRPLSIQTISDIRRACLIGSNQLLFHALRVCSPPFHRTDGIQVPSVRTASDTLILGGRPLDEIFIKQMSDQGFVIIFEIPLWQKRITAIGQVSMEFIVAGRMWSVTFFSTDPSLPVAGSVKSKKSVNTWHVIVSLLESSAPTFFDSRLVVDPPPNTDATQTPRPRDPPPSTTTRSRDRQPRSRSSTYDFNHDGAYSRSSCDPQASLTSEDDRYPSSSNPPASTSIGTPPPIFIHLGAGKRKLSCRTESGEPPRTVETLTTHPSTWSDHGVKYISAVVSPLGEGPSSPLLNEHSRYLLPDGTMRGRLEASLKKPESSKGCIIC